jgi:predicted dehydrogenase
MFMRARYGHGGRLGYDREWRADAAVSGGGELIDQGMHLVDLSNALHGELPLHGALVHTDYWDMDVDDNAVVTLSAPGRGTPWTAFHVSCSEWKNLFDLEIYCREAKWHVSGLAGSYGPQVLRIFRMKPEMGPPDVEEVAAPPTDDSWAREWRYFRDAIEAGDPHVRLDGGLADARYAHEIVQQIYEATGYRDPSGAALPRGSAR